MKFSSSFMLYDTSVPQYLHDRPTWFVKHCMERLHSARSYEGVHGAIVSTGKNTYTVASHMRQGERYVVHLGEVNVFPTCDCFDYRKNVLPCKHFFAVFLFGKDSWESLPESYWNNPLYTIDQSVFSSEQKQEMKMDIQEQKCTNEIDVMRGWWQIA